MRHETCKTQEEQYEVQRLTAMCAARPDIAALFLFEASKRTKRDEAEFEQAIAQQESN